ncbi:glutamate 5-kinase [Crucibulum laeve]|uniref:Glutamate 5-kinase n=1 Tax=Crucibulum laeve TaxID=68775 RepID=A0A5C3LJB4_9AGAR|nr:glutamate 5-kinase [Crucibulum laeve]
MTRARYGHPCTIVIKLGTSSIVHETTHQPLLSTLSSVVETVVHLRSQGHKVVLVSSGAIGVGLKRMDMASKPKNLSGKQALAAIGQGRLIALWDNLFGQLEQPIAQVLLTRGDISDRTRYLNAVNTFKELLSMGVVPIVNENDTVSVSEIKFGDNDTLSAITSSMIHADYLFLLTDVDGLYTSNPRKDPDAKQIEVVNSISAIRAEVSTTTLGSSLGTGGMETKLIAAEIATAAGVTTIITSSKHPENIFDILDFHGRSSGLTRSNSFSNSSRSSSRNNSRSNSRTQSFSATRTPLMTPSTPIEPLSGRASPTPDKQAIMKGDVVRPENLLRPPHTVFTASPTPMRDLKSWTSHTLFPSGSIVIDSGAHQVLSKRESGGRLLAAGVLGVQGSFASGQAVRIVVRQKTEASEEEEQRRKYARAMQTRPGTPTAFDPPSGSVTPVFVNDESIEDNEEGLGEVDVMEVGRGLANYNSAQIDRVKGLNSSHLPQLLGYADSEYVVENITIRVPPL